MKVIRSISQMQKTALFLKSKKSIAVVPTMGYLHEGHLSLVKLAKKKADITIVTIFVNPLQFGKNEDLKKYPRDEKSDLFKLKKLNIDFVFIPKAKDMYNNGFQTSVRVKEVTKPLCGKSRPGHFQGVATVVLKLFQITQPDFAIFGKKDYQQWLTIKTMTQDLNLPIQIIGTNIVRDKDGLALSSRNAYLSPSQRDMALSITRGLTMVKRACQSKSLSVSKIKKIFLTEIPKNKIVKVDYIECLDANNLNPIRKHVKGHTLVATAVFIGKTRLIDNIVI